MKIKIGDKVFLQKYEVAHIIHETYSVPLSFMRETFPEKSGCFVMNGAADCFRFKCVYKDPESIKWIMEQDWIVDFDEYSKMSPDELYALCERLYEEYSKGIDEFNAKDDAYREAHYYDDSDKFEKAEHKLSSLKTLYNYLKGETKFAFPRGYKPKA